MFTDSPQEVLPFLRANENDAEKALKVLIIFEGILEKIEKTKTRRMRSRIKPPRFKK